MSDKPVVFFISPEVAPFAKTGGLADVAGSLPSALHRLGVEVAVGLPFYRLIKEENLSLREKIPRLEVPLGEEVLACKVLETKTEEAPGWNVRSGALSCHPSSFKLEKKAHWETPAFPWTAGVQSDLQVLTLQRSSIPFWIETLGTPMDQRSPGW